MQMPVWLGRTCPQMDCEVFFEREEWQAAYIVARKQIPKELPSLNAVIRIAASFGGFLGRMGDGVPGTKYLVRSRPGPDYSASWISPPAFVHTAPATKVV